jgi:NAD(P)-dependent dehydrogenase (short-subunit alcohol dehydrogenase family)
MEGQKGLLDGQHVLIVGGGSGIGRATAVKAATAGADVTIAGRTLSKLEAVRDALSGTGREIGVQSTDMTNDASVSVLFERLAPSHLDHLVITAAQTKHGLFADLPLQDAQSVFTSKFWGPYRVACAALPRLRDHGSIVFFSGVLSRRPGLNCSTLGAVNAAVEGLTRSLALELGPRLRVNCISPGMVRSEAYAAMPEEQRRAMYEATGESLPVHRVGEVDEIADAVLFLMVNGYVTGLVLDVDGGHMVRQYARR